MAGASSSPLVIRIILEFKKKKISGLIDKDETVEEAALRELREETGYSAKLENIVHK